ncbi:MAG: Nif3-like dinuclear metal center hexameric protein [Bacteroidota bacterium]
MPQIKDIIAHLEQIAPLAYQEAYDNSGLLVGNAAATVQNVLICLDVTEAVLQEAQAHNCNLIVAHHPLLFQPIKQLTGRTAVERCLLQAIQHHIAIYTIHTNLDNVFQGVNQHLAQTIGLQQLSILQPKPDTWRKLTTFAPPTAVKPVLQALHQAGAGCIGDYTHCSFFSTGTGTFQPKIEAQPYTGVPQQLSQVAEERIEVLFPTHLQTTIIRTLQATHPYQEVAYNILPIANPNTRIGAGMLGILPESLSSEAFLDHLQATLALCCIRHTKPIDRPIRRVAICGGAGIHLLKNALAQQADALVTADVKYHDFFKAEDQILLADIGHYESEIGTKDLLHALLSEKFASIAFLKCQTVTNPIHYR